jgi:hypothetical protein
MLLIIFSSMHTRQEARKTEDKKGRKERERERGRERERERVCQHRNLLLSNHVTSGLAVIQD